MIKYLSFISESSNTQKLKDGDKIIYHMAPDKKYYSFYDNKPGIIKRSINSDNYPYASGYGKYYVQIGGIEILANESELELFDPNSIESSTESPKSTENQEIIVGSKVIVNGTSGRMTYNDVKGEVLRLNRDEYFIKFDGFSSLIDKKLVKLAGGNNVVSTQPNTPKENRFNLNDKVKCLNGNFKDNVGTITKVWDDDNTYMVEFIDAAGTVSIFKAGSELELIKAGAPIAPKSPTRKIGFEIPNVENKTNPSTISLSSEEEDDDDGEGQTLPNNLAAPFKKDDLMEFSYKDFLLEEKISTHEDLLKLKTRYEQEMLNTDLSKIKKLFYEKSLKTMEVIESYYQFLINKIAKDLPVLRTVEQIENKDLLRNKTKVRASDSKELTRKYSFDQGIIAYWKFKDAVVFRTL